MDDKLIDLFCELVRRDRDELQRLREKAHELQHSLAHEHLLRQRAETYAASVSEPAVLARHGIRLRDVDAAEIASMHADSIFAGGAEGEADDMLSSVEPFGTASPSGSSWIPFVRSSNGQDPGPLALEVTDEAERTPSNNTQ